VGFGALGRANGDAGHAPSSGTLTMAVHGRDWHLHYPDRPRGVLPSPGERSASYGQLFEGPDGERIGEFYASSFAFGAPFGPGQAAATALEIHHFNLSDGTIVGTGAIRGYHDDPSVHAITGGTGRYEGASGSYTARQRPVELGGDGTAEFSFNLILRSL
jgi:hypothetical protein